MEKTVLLQKTVRRVAGRAVAVDAERLREIKNHRRVQLIRKASVAPLTTSESADLARLQDDRVADAERDFPLPWAKLERAEKVMFGADTAG